MSQPDHEGSNVISFDGEAQQIMTSIRGLTRTIVDAWQSRSVILTQEERQVLREEIRDTCALLTDLTSGE